MFLEDFEIETEDRSIGDKLSEYENMIDPQSEYWNEGCHDYPLALKKSKLPVKIHLYQVTFCSDGRSFQEKVRADSTLQAKKWIETTYPGVHIQSTQRRHRCLSGSHSCL